MYFFTFNEMITFDGIFLCNDVINLLNFRSDRAVSDPWNTNRQPWGESCISTVILASLRTTSLRLFSFFCRCSWGEIVSATFKRWLSDVLGVVCSVILSQRASFHCIAHIPPFFYPHDLVFNMDAENSSTTAQFMSLANPFNHILCRTVARNLQCRLTIVYLSCLNNYFVTT